MPRKCFFPENPGDSPEWKSELRLDFPGGFWVLFAPERAKRPNDFRTIKSAAGTDSSRRSCPFCPGREGDTPSEVAARREKGSVPDSPGWRVRVVPNKFPALIRPSAPAYSREGEERGDVRPGHGFHEVVIDGPDHDQDWADFPEDRLREVLAVFRDRLQFIEKEPSIRYLQIFKNKGGEAGASLRHPHTQILALPVVPGQVRREVEAMVGHGKASGSCYACRMIAEEESGPRLIQTGKEFVALAPFASRFSYEIHVRPRRHSASFSDLSDEELLPLAGTMRDLFRRLRSTAGDPPFHLVLRQAPVLRDDQDDKHLVAAFMHWRFEILPVLGAVAGFEWGTGCFINPVLPERAASALRLG
jgi:UDPglucose--hexose-1-phosphate uridylyltransferase